MKGKTALITNILPHYRKSIFNLLIENNIDVYGGDSNKLGIKVLNIKNYKGYYILQNIYIKKLLIWQKKIFRLFRKNYNSFILIGDMYILSSWLFIILAKLNGKQIFLWTHGLRGSESFIKRKLRLIFYNLSDGLLLYGHKSESLLRKFGFQKHIFVVYNSLDFEEQNKFFLNTKVEELQCFRANLFDNNEAILIYSGRITKSRKLHQLIEAISILNSEFNKNINLLIVGDGAEIDSLKKLAKKKSVSTLFYGPCYNEVDLSILFQISSICVSPGDVGLTAIHSLTYGTPVITHNNYSTQKPEHEAISSGISGDFYPENDIAALSNLIYHWISLSDHKKIINDCRQIVIERYNPKVQTQIITDALSIP